MKVTGTPQKAAVGDLVRISAHCAESLNVLHLLGTVGLVVEIISSHELSSCGSSHYADLSARAVLFNGDVINFFYSHLVVVRTADEQA